MSFPRYAEYKDSGVEWLGEVPEHWEVKRLKRAFRLLTEKTDRREFPVALENIESWSGRFIPTETEFEGEGVAFERGDILFGKLRPYLAKALLVNKGGEAVGDFHVLRPSQTVNGQFAIYQILNREFISVIDGSTFGAKMPRASWDFMANIILAFPSIQEQTQIAAFLDHETAKLDNLINQQKKLIELLKEKRQAVISHAVTKGLNPNAPMSDSGVEWLGEVPEHWQVLQFRRITYLSQGLQIPQNERVYEPLTNTIEYITIKSINTKSGLNKEYIFNASERVTCTESDVLLARTGATGEVVTGVKGAFHNNFFKISYSEEIIKEFLVFLLKVTELKAHLLMLAGTTTIPDLNHGAFLATKIALPNHDEQIEIIKYLNSYLIQIEHLEKKAESAIQLLQERRTALISAAVTGKIDVRGFVKT